MKRGAESAKVFSRDMKSIGLQATQVGTALTKTLTLPIIGVGGAVAKLAMDFESSFAGVRKTVDASEAEFDAMSQSFRDLSKEIPVNVNELNRLGEAAGALGIPKAEIVDFARVMSLLGVTTNVTSDQAAESIAKIQNIFKSAGKETDNFASTLVALGNEGASTEAEILGLANRIASAGNTVGLSQAQVLGFSSAIANVGIEAEAGGSAMSRVFIDISSAVSKGGSDVEEFARVAGLSIDAFSEKFKTDAAGATTSFIEGLGRIKAEGGDLNITLEKLGFTELRQANLLRSLALSGDNLSKSLHTSGEAWKSNSALTEEARKRFETTASQLTLLWNAIKDVGITLGNALLPMIQATVGWVRTMIPIIETAAKIFAALPMPVQAVGIGLLAVAAAAGPLIFIMGQMALSASAVAAAFTAKGIATRGLTASLAGLRLGLTAVGTAIMAMPFAAAAAGLALVTAATVKWIEASANARLEAETAGAKQDTINRALLLGAKTNITYAEAVEFVTEKENERLAAFTGAKNAADAFIGPIQDLGSKNVTLASQIGKARAELTGMSAEVRQDLVGAIKSGAHSVEEMAKASGLSEMAVKLFKDQLEASGKKATEAAAAIDEFRDAAAEATIASNLGVFSLHKFGAITLPNVTGRAREFADALRDWKAPLDVAGRTLEDLGRSGQHIAATLQDLGANAMMGVLVPAIHGIEQGTEAATSKMEAFGDIVDSTVKKLSAAFVGGGGVGGAIKSMATESIGSIGKMIGEGGIGKAIAGGITKLGFGATAATTIAIGAATLGIGAAVMGAYAGIKKWLGSISAHMDTNDIRDKVLGAAGGFATLSKEIVKATGSNALVKQLLDAKTPEAFKVAMDGVTEALEQYSGRLKAAETDIAGLGASFSTIIGGARLASDTMGDLSTIAISTYASMITAGFSHERAVGLMHDGLGRLREAYERLKIPIDNVALQALLLTDTILTKNPDLLAAVGALGSQFQILSQYGLLNVDTFEAMERTGLEMYGRLQAEVAAVGGSTRDALMPMQGFLHDAEKAAKDLGIPMDEYTADLIFQSKELGIWKDAGKSANDLLLDGLGKLIEKMDAFLSRIGGIGPIAAPWDGWSDPPAGPDYPGAGADSSGAQGAARGGLVTSHGIVQYMDRGGFVPRGRDIIPAMLAPGELILTRGHQDALRSNASALLAGASGSGTVIVNINAQGAYFDTPASRQRLADKTGKAVMGELHRTQRLGLS